MADVLGWGHRVVADEQRRSAVADVGGQRELRRPLAEVEDDQQAVTIEGAGEGVDMRVIRIEQMPVAGIGRCAGAVAPLRRRVTRPQASPSAATKSRSRRRISPRAAAEERL